MNRQLFFIISFLLCLTVHAQQNTNTGHKKQVLTLLKEYNRTKDTLLKNTILSASSPIKYDSIYREANIIWGTDSYFKKDLKGLQISARNLLDSYHANKDSFALAKQLHYKALYFRRSYKTDSCFYYYHQSKNVSILIKDSIQVVRRLLSMANMQRSQKDFLGSEITIIEGLRFAEPLKNEVRYTSSLYNVLGLVLHETGKQKEARVFYDKFYALSRKNKQKLVKDRAYLDFNNNVGLSYHKEDNFKKAISLFSKALLLDSLEIKFPYRYQSLHENLADSYLSIGNNSGALKGLKLALQSRESHGFLVEQSVSHTLLSECYQVLDNDKMALFHAKKGLEIGKRTNSSLRVLQNLNSLSRLTPAEEGIRYLEAYIILNDSIHERERTLKNQFAKVRYETDKKDKENINLKVENSQKELEIESEKQQKTIGWLLAGGSILFIGFGASVVTSRKKKLLFNAKLQQIEAREKERQQIAKSLHDEVAGDIRMLHLKLAQTNQESAANSLNIIKRNVRNLSHELSSEDFEKVSFKDQIIGLVSDFFEKDFQIKVHGIDYVVWVHLNNVIKRMLFLAIRECILNSKKHGKASVVNISFEETNKAIILIVLDNGKGFDTTIKKPGIGLKNMQERVAEINGIFSIKSELENGTSIHIEIPKSGA